MMQRITAQLPAWMRTDHPVLRYVLRDRETRSSRNRYTRAFITLVLIALFLLGGYAAASNFFQDDPFEQPLSQMLMDILFWPTFVLQIVLQITVMLLTINTVGEAKRRQTWDHLRTTSFGAALAMRTRWSSVIFYRMRWMIALLILVRLILIAGILYDLTAFRGEYLNYLTASITPSMPLAAGVILLALMMTASLLLPVTGLGMDTALGLMVSTLVHQRTYIVLTQIAIIAVRAAIVGLLLIGVTQFRTGTLEASDLIVWVILAGFAVIGDWGLSLLYLGYYGAEIWSEVPYGIFIGLAALVFVMFQAALTDGILSLAIYRAERSE